MEGQWGWISCIYSKGHRTSPRGSQHQSFPLLLAARASGSHLNADVEAHQRPRGRVVPPGLAEVAIAQLEVKSPFVCSLDSW